jgi:hypothetical protein
MDTGFVLSNNNHGGGLFSENGIDWTPIGIAFPMSESVVTGGKRWYLNWTPLGIDNALESSVYTISETDLSLEKVRLVSSSPQVETLLVIRVSVRNSGPEAISFDATRFQARLSDGENWIGSQDLIVGDEELPSLVLGSQEFREFDLLLELPEVMAEEHTSIQLLLNPDRSPPEVDLSNNYAWLRLLPTPKISIEDQHDSTIRVEWNREGGYVKRIEYSHDLENWFLLDAPEESTESGIYTESIDPNRETFYRARAE